MAVANSLTYLLYSLLTLAGQDAPTTDPSLRAWEVNSEPPVTRTWNQEPYNYALKHGEDSCPAGEVYSDCDAGCQETCENVGKPVICPRMCVPGCVCEEPGAVRGSDGSCIPAPMCSTDVEPPVTRNAEDDRDPPVTRRPKHDRESPVTRHAEDDREPPVTRRAEDDREPPVTRRSEDDRDGEDSCPSGEVYSDCDAGCQETCENVGKPVICPRMCVPGCVCEEPGAVRGSDGSCIPAPMCSTDVVDPDEIYHAEQNPQIHGDCPKLEEITCKKFCERNCDNMDRKDLPCPRFCIRGCTCKQGYVRGADGNCIDPKKCPKNSGVSHQEPQPDAFLYDSLCRPDHRKCQESCKPKLGFCMWGRICFCAK